MFFFLNTGEKTNSYVEKSLLIQIRGNETKHMAEYRAVNLHDIKAKYRGCFLFFFLYHMEEPEFLKWKFLTGCKLIMTNRGQKCLEIGVGPEFCYELSFYWKEGWIIRFTKTNNILTLWSSLNKALKDFCQQEENQRQKEGWHTKSKGKQKK